MNVSLFPMSDYWWLYLVFLGIVLVMLLLDLGVFHRKSHEVSFKEASIWTMVWISLAMLFNLGLWRYSLWKFPQDERLTAIPGFDPVLAANQTALEFLSGFVVEKALAVDNIFVFAVVFSYFAIPKAYQHRVLFYGILGALIFRAIFIGIGSLLMQYQWVVYLFGAILLITAVKLMFAPEKAPDPGKNPIVRLTRRLLPVTDSLRGENFFVRENKVLYATPLFLALVFLEFTDIIFAVDSVPAIFALTKEPFIVFTSNIFAILGLRSMYFMLASVMDRFHYLKTGLAFILAFVGLKMVWLNEMMGGKFPIAWSLSIIVGILAVSVLASLMFPKEQETSNNMRNAS
jgi:tellurite resistance protein TerC